MQKGDWSRWRALPSWERRVLLRAWWRLLFVQMQLRCDPGIVTGRRLGVCAKQQSLPAGMEPVVFARRCQALVAIAASKLPRPANCLPQALVLEQELLRHGLSAQFKLGVQGELQPFSAHAWVEYAGIRLGDHNDAYHSFEGLP